MDSFRRFPIPSFQAMLNVAWETIKAYMPENSPCGELIGLRSGQQEPGERTSFKEGSRAMGESTEMATMAEQGGYEATGECRTSVVPPPPAAADSGPLLQVSRRMVSWGRRGR